ncbi:glycosyltransferase family 2 protein [Hydrogenimonas thermophila]|uniref:Glycosyltransferase involved in cell wall bisynthesis n=1 Tax=Hydrogenimonas thermophila TaxID=223786 RepID=A0A1I5KQ92_9BACT|nr:glycosyltransferase family 2 protein [Hydrogenimonas thermophila]SFO87178.1 Glycosyltransferase involved in cell wall bisynthesis [Hydrogenimonas thermophila]
MNLVSVITPSYNSSKFIAKTIESVLNQTYQNWEMIIVDDVSSDNSNEIIEGYRKKDNRIKLIKLEKNSGPAIARNIGIKKAKGRFIAFLDSDDIWLPQKLQKQIDFMITNDLSLTYSAYDTIDEIGNKINTRYIKEYITYTDMLKTNHIGNLTGIYDSKKIGKFYMDNVGHEDYTLWLKIMNNIKETKGLNEPLAQYRIISNSISANKLKVIKWQWNIYRNILNLSLLKSSYYFVYYIFNAIKKRKA